MNKTCDFDTIELASDNSPYFSKNYSFGKFKSLLEKDYALMKEMIEIDTQKRKMPL